MKTKNVLQNILNGVKTDLATLTKEANKGNGENKLALAWVYENGYFGIPKDSAKAFEWAEKAFKDKKKIITRQKSCLFFLLRECFSFC